MPPKKSSKKLFSFRLIEREPGKAPLRARSVKLDMSWSAPLDDDEEEKLELKLLLLDLTFLLDDDIVCVLFRLYNTQDESRALPAQSAVR